MSKTMTVGDLKQILAKYDDNMLVYYEGRDGYSELDFDGEFEGEYEPGYEGWVDYDTGAAEPGEPYRNIPRGLVFSEGTECDHDWMKAHE